MNVVEAIRDDRFFKGLFKDLETWAAWTVFLKSLFGLKIEDRRDRKLFRQCTGRRRPPGKAAKEAYVVCGRRSGKSFISAIVAVYLACFRSWSEYLSPGELGHIFIIANDRQQAQIIKKYISGIMDSKAIFRNLIKDDLQWQINLKNNIVISVKTSNFRAVRGYTILCVIAEEVAFWRDLESSANPAHEVIEALKPGMASIPESLLIGISTPHGKFGFLYEKFQEFYGEKNDDVLTWRAKSTLMNPTIDPSIIEKALHRDKASAKAEWLAEFREDLEDFLSLELIEKAVIPGRIELPPVKDVRYHGFCDPSGGRKDSMALGITHRNKDEKIIVDLIRESRPPFSPDDVVREFAKVLKKYGIYQCFGDSYSAEWVASSFRKNGIMYEISPSSKSELYLGLLPLLSNFAVEILDDKVLKGQLRSLERYPKSGGRDRIDHPGGCHDDVSNVVAGAALLASKADGDDLADITLQLAEQDEIESLTDEEKNAARITKWLLGGELESPEEAKKPLIGKPKTCLTVSEWMRRSGK
ncbi:hypothetical protein ES702_03827 [subsurface metagenome]